MKSMLKLMLIASLQASIFASLSASYQAAPNMPQLVGNFPAAEMSTGAKPTETSLLIEHTHSPESIQCSEGPIHFLLTNTKKCPTKDCRWRCCGCTAIGGLFVLFVIALTRSTDMAGTCYSVYPTDCGSCATFQESPVLCPIPTTNGSLPYGQFIKKMREEFDPICGTQAQYNVRTWPCGEGAYTCSDNFADYKRTVAAKCAQKPAQKFRTKFMKRGNDGRKR